MWEMERMLITSIFSFSRTIFYPSKHNFQFYRHIRFVVCKYLYIWTNLKFGRLVKRSLFTSKKILDKSKFKAFEVDILIFWKKKLIISIFHMVENIVGKGEMAFLQP